VKVSGKEREGIKKERKDRISIPELGWSELGNENKS
jgi:hypothetical protein